MPARPQRQTLRQGRNAVLFSRDIGLPRIGDPIGDRDASVSINAGEVNANAWGFNPFSGEVPRGGDPVYNPWCTGSTGCDPYAISRGDPSKKPGGVLGSAAPVIAVVALLALAGGGK